MQPSLSTKADRQHEQGHYDQGTDWHGDGFPGRAARRDQRAWPFRHEPHERCAARHVHQFDAVRGCDRQDGNLWGPRTPRARPRGAADRHARGARDDRPRAHAARGGAGRLEAVSRSAARRRRGPRRAGSGREARCVLSGDRRVRRDDHRERSGQAHRRRQPFAGCLQRSGDRGRRPATTRRSRVSTRFASSASRRSLPA
jgi:hypothetical protein